MPGLVPGIHAFGGEDVDGWIKPAMTLLCSAVIPAPRALPPASPRAGSGGAGEPGSFDDRERKTIPDIA